MNAAIIVASTNHGAYRDKPMIYTVAAGMAVFLLMLSLILIQRSRRYMRYQAKLGAAFERAQEVRMRRPPGLYGDRAWTPVSSRSRGSQITMLNLR